MSAARLAKYGGEKVNKLEELETVSKPLVDYIRKNYHPHTAIIVTDERAIVLEDVMSVVFPVDD